MIEEHKSQNATYEPAAAARLAAQYKVSRDTIIRDSKVSEAIDAIGATSPEVKRMILEGEVTIKKKDLSALTSMMSEDIDTIAVKIEEGTYDKKNTSPSVPAEPLTPLEAATAGVQSLAAALAKASAILFTIAYI